MVTEVHGDPKLIPDYFLDEVRHSHPNQGRLDLMRSFLLISRAICIIIE